MLNTPVAGETHLRRNGVVAHPGLPQADDLPPPFLLRRRRQLAHVHVLHARKVQWAQAIPSSHQPDQ
jgi:hypothetical protein